MLTEILKINFEFDWAWKLNEAFNQLNTAIPEILIVDLSLPDVKPVKRPEERKSAGHFKTDSVKIVSQIARKYIKRKEFKSDKQIK